MSPNSKRPFLEILMAGVIVAAISIDAQPNADQSKDVPFDAGPVEMKRFDYSAPEN